jgi:asparagine synthase (glutamine-hydrolysing)
LIRLNLSHVAGYGWNTVRYGADRIHYKGNDWEIGADLRRWCASGEGSGEELLRLAADRSYAFALVVEGEKDLIAAVDQLRSHPLFYRHVGSDLTLTDDPYSPAAGLSPKCDAQLPLAEFLLAGYVTGSETLSTSVKSLQAAECLVASNLDGRLQVCVRRYRPGISETVLADGADVTRRLMEVCDEIFVDLVRGLAGRQVMLPLSSGVDSRFIACMLKRHGHANVAAFTYGRPGNWEEAVSRRTAEALGYPWHFVPYSRHRWRAWYRGDDMRAYLPFSSRHVATPHIQDWPAVMELKNSRILQEDAVFVPGHTSVLISNRLERWVFRLPPEQRIEALGEMLCKHHFMLQRERRVLEDPGALRRRVRALLPPSAGGTPHALLNAYFHFEATERHSKMLINSVRAYEFWGHQWALPLWDGRLIDLWAKVPYDGRYAKHAFREFLYHSDLYSLFPRPGPPGPYHRLREAAKGNSLTYAPLKRLKCSEERLLGYFHHFLDWYGIVSYPQFVYHMGRCGNIYSLLSRLYLKTLQADDAVC